MAVHGFWQYIKLKIIVTVIRILNYYGTRRHFEPSSECRRKQIRLPSRQLHRFIIAWIYYPNTYDENESKPQGLVINWHGGAYILSNLGMDHTFCERIAREGNVLVLDADYRKGPEHPFPGAVEDAEDVLRWVESQAHMFDLDRIALSGFSSGGNLALVAASELRQKFQAMKIRAVYAFYPGVDFSIAPEDKTVPEPVSPLPIFAQHLIADCYVPRLSDRVKPEASPAYAPTSSFPAQGLLFVCSGDVLAPETETLARKLEQAGSDIQLVRVEGAAHGFDKTIKPDFFDAEQRDITYAKVVENLRKLK